MVQSLFGFILLGLLLYVLDWFCKWTNLGHKDIFIKVIIFKSINTIYMEQIFRIDNTIIIVFIQLV